MIHNHLPEGIVNSDPGLSGGNPKVATVKFSELGTECWRPSRFTGSECLNMKGCHASCKKTCKAYMVQAVYKKTMKRVEANGSESEIVPEYFI